MNQNLDRSTKLLRFYPKAYREERGEEIVATLQEAAEARVPRVSLSDQISVALYGVRIRLGLTRPRDGSVFWCVSLNLG